MVGFPEELARGRLYFLHACTAVDGVARLVDDLLEPLQVVVA
jgi:hypothetical protein